MHALVERRIIRYDYYPFRLFRTAMPLNLFFTTATQNHRRQVGVSMVEYALVLALIVLPIMLAVNSPELRTALQNVFTGTVNTKDTSGSLQLEAFGEH